MAVQTVFKRREIKYIVSAEQRSELLDRLAPYIEQDSYGRHTISSIYFDTDDDRIIRTSLDKPIYKEKLRLRCYGSAEKASDTVFLELKKKFKGTVYKRRIAMKLYEAQDYLRYGIPPEKDSQIFREIDWFMNFYHPYPKIMIAYDRLAYTGRDDSALRITFDMNIRARRDRLSFIEGSGGDMLLEDGFSVMEIKICNAMPLRLSEILSEAEVFPTSFSKYGTEYMLENQRKITVNHSGAFAAEFGDEEICSQVS